MTVLLGKRYRGRLEQSLAAQGLETIWLPDDPALDLRLAGHADLSVFRAGRHIFAAREVAPNIVNYLTNRGYIVEPVDGLGRDYPADVLLCICATGAYTIYAPKTAYPGAVAAAAGIPILVRQGYARCAVSVVNEHSIITADASVSRAAKKAGMDVLDITPGHVVLDGYDTGFIGGASFLIDDKMLFTGTLDKHPDKERIAAFLAKHGKTPVYLTDAPVFDIGGAILV